MQHLGDYSISKPVFPQMKALLEEFEREEFKNLGLQERLNQVCRALLQEIEKAPEGEFLLIPTLEFIEQVHERQIVDHFHFNLFELWLDQQSGLSVEEDLKIRGKIAGRFIPRDMYQELFPIGMGKIYPGPHFVTAHASPDLDTTVASFWGWIDAFSARVAKGIHVWNIPGGEPPSQAETSLLFFSIFGNHVFELLAKHRLALSVSGIDLVSQDGVVHKSLTDPVLDLDPEKEASIALVVGEKGEYLGEWKLEDAEKVRSIVNLFHQCLRWYQNYFHVQLINLFTENMLSQKRLHDFFTSMQKMRIEESLPAKEFTQAQKEAVNDYLVTIFSTPEGVKSSFALFAEALSKRGLYDFEKFDKRCLEADSIFDPSGHLTADRSKIFHYLSDVITLLEKAICSIREHVDLLSIALEIKTKLFGLSLHHVNYLADLEEIRSKMSGSPYVTVTSSDHQGTLFPLGVIHAKDIFKNSLGTVTLRDFSNREETKVPPYLDIISVLDHHKSQLATAIPTVSRISDVQSANVLVAQISFALSDPFSSGGMSREEIDSQIEEIKQNLQTPSQIRIFQRLLKRQIALAQKTAYFVAPEREMIEYLHCLYAILDDTDLLSKVSAADVKCVAEILNRLKSLMLRKEIEIIHFDDLAQDEMFAKKAAKRILQNNDMYSLYCKIYSAKEEAIEENLRLVSQGKSSNIFADTKEQNGCCRIGQTKLFPRNFAAFTTYAPMIRSHWLSSAQKVQQTYPYINFHLHMISTISGADEVYRGKNVEYGHQDELWLWSAEREIAIQHLKSFLSAFSKSPGVENNQMDALFLGKNGKELAQVIEESFGSIPHHFNPKEDLPIVILRYRAGSLNSRKSMISPYLPTIL